MSILILQTYETRLDSSNWYLLLVL